MGIKLVKFLGGTYTVSESVKILLDELNKKGFDDGAKRKLLMDITSIADQAPFLFIDLMQNPEFDFTELKKYDMKMSKKILMRMEQTSDKKMTLTQAFVFCPYLQEIYLACADYGLLDWETYRIAEYLGFGDQILEKIETLIKENPDKSDLYGGIASVYAQARNVGVESLWSVAEAKVDSDVAATKAPVKTGSERKKKTALPDRPFRKKAVKKESTAEKIKESKAEKIKESKSEKIKKSRLEGKKKGKTAGRKPSLLGVILVALLLVVIWKFVYPGNKANLDGEAGTEASTTIDREFGEQEHLSTDAEAPAASDQETGDADAERMRQEDMEKKVQDLRVEILEVISGTMEYELNDETNLFGFKKAVKNTTGETLKNVVLEVSVDQDVNRLTREVWNPEEEWTLVVYASENTLVKSDIPMDVKVVEYEFE